METTTLGAGSDHPLTIPRIITGLWQLAGGHEADVDIPQAVQVMDEYIKRGLAAFDMADHYGPAEKVIGEYKRSKSQATLHPDFTAFTKWCPEPQARATDLETVTEAVDLAREKMGDKPGEALDNLQFHIWKYSDRHYINIMHHLSSLRPSKLHHLSLTNTDLAHLKLLHDSGIQITTNQVSISVLDRRVVTGGMAKWCAEHNVGLLGYGVLLGGFLSEKWVGKEEPTEGAGLDNWSLKKYKRFIDAAGGWDVFQHLLSVLATIATKHSVPLAAIAIRHVLDIPGVSAVILGSRLTPSSLGYLDSSLSAFSVTLDEEDKATIQAAQEKLRDIPGDSGDEYRRRPYLTAKGDLGDHLDVDGWEGKRAREVERVIESGGRVEYSSGSIWEPIAGYTRAVRYGSTITISGTTAPHLSSTPPRAIGGKSAASQAICIFDLLETALLALNSSLRDVVRTRIYLVDADDCEAVTKEHARVFNREGVRPSNTTFGGVRLIGGDLKVEIEVDAIVGAGGGEVLRIT